MASPHYLFIGKQRAFSAIPLKNARCFSFLKCKLSVDALRQNRYNEGKGGLHNGLRKIRNYRNKRNPYAQSHGIYLEELRPGFAKVVKTVQPEDLNPLNVPHGGVYFTMADNACGSAMAAYGYMAVTLNASYNFFKSARLGDALTAEAHELRHGKTVSTFEARITGPDGTLLGTGTFTFFQLDQKLPEFE